MEIFGRVSRLMPSQIKLLLASGVIFVTSCGGEEGKINPLKAPHLVLTNVLLNPMENLPNQFNQTLSSEGLSPLLKVNLDSENDYHDVKLSYAGHPLCEYDLRASPNEANGGHYLQGRYLPKDLLIPDPKIPDLTSARSQLLNYLSQNDWVMEKELSEPKPCYVVRDQELQGAYQLSFLMDNLPHLALVGESEVFLLEKRYLHVEGTSVVYERNALDTKTVEVTLKELDGVGFLEGPYLKTAYQSGTNYSKAFSNTLKFDYSDEPTSTEFRETMVYTHAQLTRDWVTSLEYPLLQSQLLLFAAGSGIYNNAVYLFGENGTPPMIVIGEADGFIFNELALDADVVSHEYGHHVIYRRIKGINQSPETTMIHEGLADFLTFARTGDACLAESVCPKSSAACQVRGKCLRTADNELTMSEYDALQQPHLRGQILSGFLWDLKDQGMALSDIAKITLNALEGMPSAALVVDFAIQILAADYRLNNGAHCPAILSGLETRQLNKNVEIELDCTKLAELDELSKEDTTTEKTATKNNVRRRETSSNDGCGVIGTQNQPLAPLMWLVLVAFVPLALPKRKS